MSLYQTQKFKELQKLWYQKLKASGFEDIEDTSNDKNYMLVWHSTYFHSRYSQDEFQAKQEYFRLADAFACRYQFDCPQQKQIWLLHADGHSLRKIASELHVTVYQVNKVIKILSALMLED